MNKSIIFGQDDELSDLMWYVDDKLLKALRNQSS